MATPESKVKEKIKKILKANSIWYYMPVSMGMGQHGIPDFLCCLNGRLFTIEAKAGTNKPTALQEIQMSRLREAGAHTFVINEANIGELDLWITAMYRQGL
jgi:hypothetical protein